MGLDLVQAADRERSLAVDCPSCPAVVGEVCKRWDWRSDRWVELGWLAAHTPRLKAAGVVHAPVDVREIRGA